MISANMSNNDNIRHLLDRIYRCRLVGLSCERLQPYPRMIATSPLKSLFSLVAELQGLPYVPGKLECVAQNVLVIVIWDE